MGERLTAIENAANAMQIMSNELGRNMIGNELPRELTVGSLVVGQHILFEGEPGTGKTELAKRVSTVTGLSYGRVQGVADTLPADIIGYELPSLKDDENRIHFGPIHSNIVFVDEMNRMSTKAQSALNAAMAEGKVTIGNNEYKLNGDRPFMVVATQNEHGNGQGTFPVSDALYDRFGMVVPFTEPTTEDVKAAIRQQIDGHAAETTSLEDVIDEKQLMEISRTAGKIAVKDAEMDVIADLATIIRSQAGGTDIRVMGGYRLPKALTKIVQARALQDGRAHVTMDDIREIAPLVMGHRIDLRSDESIAERQQVVRTALENTLV